MARDTSGGDVHTLAGAYVLDALTDLDRARFDRHTAECEVCAAEVAELRETVGRMAETNWSVPPPRMRRDVLAEISRTRQVGGRRREDARLPGAPAQWRRRTAMTVAAAVLAAGGGLATWAVLRDQQRDEHGQLVAEQTRSRQISDILSAPDAQLHRAGQVSIVVSPSRDAGVAILDDLPDPGRTAAYQLWSIPAQGAPAAVPVGLLAAGQHSGTFLVRNMTGAEYFGVSREPAGGSRHPTPSGIVQTVKLL
jgi:anti-sigma-K factor RskA